MLVSDVNVICFFSIELSSIDVLTVKGLNCLKHNISLSFFHFFILSDANLTDGTSNDSDNVLKCLHRIVIAFYIST